MLFIIIIYYYYLLLFLLLLLQPGARETICYGETGPSRNPSKFFHTFPSNFRTHVRGWITDCFIDCVQRVS